MQKINYKKALSRINTMIFDIDGVFTDGKVLVMENGEMVRNMYGKDGYALHLALEKSYRIVVISGGNNIAVKTALNRAGVKDVFINVKDKLVCFNEYLQKNGINKEQVLYMGDDLPDHKVMCAAGLAVCPEDSAPEIKEISSYVSPRKGGEGCVRDIIEQVLRAQGKWEISNW